MESVVIIVSPLSWSQSTALLLFYALGSVDVHILVYVMYKAKKKKAWPLLNYCCILWTVPCVLEYWKYGIYFNRRRKKTINFSQFCLVRCSVCLIWCKVVQSKSPFYSDTEISTLFTTVVYKTTKLTLILSSNFVK